MRIDSIHTGSIAGGTTISKKVSKGHINGFLVFCTEEHAQSVLTIKRTTPARTHVLATNFALRDFRNIADSETGYGLGLGSHLDAIYDQLVASAVAGFTEANRETMEQTHGELGLFAYYVDLGSLWLAGDSEVDFQLTKPTAAIAGEVRIYTVSRFKSADFMYQYDVSSDAEQRFDNVDAVWIGHSGPGMIRLNDATNAFTLTDGTTDYSRASIVIDDGENTYLNDVVGAWSGTMCLGNVGAIAPQELLTLYKRADSIPASLFIKLNGFSLANGTDRLLVRRLSADVSVVSSQTIREAMRVGDRLAEFEKKDPELARALRHAGLIGKSTVFYEAAAAASQR